MRAGEVAGIKAVENRQGAVAALSEQVALPVKFSTPVSHSSTWDRFYAAALLPEVENRGFRVEQKLGKVEVGSNQVELRRREIDLWSSKVVLCRGAAIALAE